MQDYVHRECLYLCHISCMQTMRCSLMKCMDRLCVSILYIYVYVYVYTEYEHSVDTVQRVAAVVHHESVGRSMPLRPVCTHTCRSGSESKRGGEEAGGKGGGREGATRRTDGQTGGRSSLKKKHASTTVTAHRSQDRADALDSVLP